MRAKCYRNLVSLAPAVILMMIFFNMVTYPILESFAGEQKADKTNITSCTGVQRIGSKWMLKLYADEDASISGRVLDGETKNPVPGALVRVFWRVLPWDPDYAEVRTLTSDKGEFEIAGLSRWQTCLFQVEAHGHIIFGRKVKIDLDDPRVDFGDILMKKGIPIKISVTDEKGNSIPSPYIRTYIWNGKKWINNGEFSGDENGKCIARYEPGYHYLYIKAQGYMTTQSGKVEIKRDSKGPKYTLKKGGSITGKVLNKEGEHINGVRVFAKLDGYEDYDCVHTNKSGEFKITGCHPGKKYRLGFMANGYLSTVRHVEAGNTGVLVKLIPNFILTGKVTDAVTGEPLNRVYLSFDKKSVGPFKTPICFTNPRGVFYYEMRYKPEKLTVSVSPDGYDALKKTFAIPENASGSYLIDFALTRGTCLRGKVTDKESGKPITGANVFAVGHGFIGQTEVETDKSGKFIAGGLEVGTYSIWIYRKGYVLHRAGDKEVGKEGSAADFALSKGGAVTGIVSDESGKPIQNARLVVEDIYSGRLVHFPMGLPYDYLSTETDSEGMYELSGLVSGYEHKLEINALDLIPEELKVTANDGKVITLNINMKRGGVIEGRVLDEFGKAIPYSSVVVMWKDVPDGTGKDAWRPDDPVELFALWRTKADKSGYYRIAGLRSGKYEVSAAKEDKYFITEKGLISVKAGKSTRVDIVLMLVKKGRTGSIPVVPKPPKKKDRQR